MVSALEFIKSVTRKFKKVIVRRQDSAIELELDNSLDLADRRNLPCIVEFEFFPVRYIFPVNNIPENLLAWTENGVDPCLKSDSPESELGFVRKGRGVAEHSLNL